VQAFIKALRIADRAVHLAEKEFLERYGQDVDRKKLNRQLSKVYTKTMRRSLEGIGDRVKRLLLKAPKKVVAGLSVLTVFSVASAAYGADSIEAANEAVKEELVWPAAVEAGIEKWIGDPLDEWFRSIEDSGEDYLQRMMEEIMEGPQEPPLDTDTMKRIDQLADLIGNQQRLLSTVRSPNHPGARVYEKRIQELRDEIRKLDPKGRY
jgi:hypothetical protein